MNLIIVESPTKCKTLQKFLGKDYLIASSYGHIRDLPQKELGVDIKNNFEPTYVVPPKAKPHLKVLQDDMKKSKAVILATDSDREGEAIAWHLSELLKLKDPKRIVFHEITKTAIEHALKNPRKLDLKLVNSQQARRILDRLVGYKLSPFLWKKVMRGLSAGRVQSVAVRLVCEREKAIQAFVPVEYWSIAAKLLKLKTLNEIEAFLVKKDGKSIGKLEIKSEKEANDILSDLRGAQYQVSSIEKREEKRHPAPPFTTSTLQQTAWSNFKFSAKKTMTLAQALYERGFITYHRTDSVNLSAESQAMAKNFILQNFGNDYWPGFSRIFKTKSKSAQEAHEAIRPTNTGLNAEEFTKNTKISGKDIKNLYDLIWQRFLASQMQEATFNSMAVEIQANNYTFQANGQTLKFDGFLKVYPTKFTENELPVLEKNELLDLKELSPLQHFTQPPARYSEATLVKALEKEEIGRPSTYAPIMDTIQQRGYVEKDEKKKLKPTKIGTIVNDVLVENFPQIVDLTFTAKMEKELDEIAEGKDTWAKTLKDFYIPFEENLKIKEREVIKKDLTEKTDQKCPECGADVIIRLGKYGKFLACSAFPKCKYTENIKRPSIGIKCPKCFQGEIVEKITKRKKIFYGCANWPKCDFAMWDKPIDKTCPQCDALMAEKRGGKEVCSNKECLTKNPSLKKEQKKNDKWSRRQT